LRGLGITHAVFNAPHAYTGAPLQTLAKDVIPAVADW